MTKCKVCKSKIRKDIEFCSYCGEPQKGKDMAHLIIVLDRSGSMSSVKEATIEGFNQFISDQKKVPLPAMLSLYQFDDIYEAVYEHLDLRDVDYLDDKTYQPRNTTALFDAIGKTINDFITYYDFLEYKHRPKKVLFCIITDGYENASKEFTSRKSVRDLMDRVKKKYKWEFAFVGAGIDAYQEASSFGIASGQTMSIANNNAGFYQATSSLSSGATCWRTSSSNASFVFKDTSTSKDD